MMRELVRHTERDSVLGHRHLEKLAREVDVSARCGEWRRVLHPRDERAKAHLAGVGNLDARSDAFSEIHGPALLVENDALGDSIADPFAELEIRCVRRRLIDTPLLCTAPAHRKVQAWISVGRAAA